MNSINKLFLNNIARSAAIVGLMLSSLAKADSNAPFVNFDRAATNFMGNTMGASNFSPNFVNNLNKVKSVFNPRAMNFMGNIMGAGNFSPNFANNLNKVKSAFNPQAMKQMTPQRSALDPDGTNKAFQKYFNTTGNNVLMNPASVKDLQTAERIANVRYGKGLGMMTKKGYSQLLEDFFRNTINQGKAKANTLKNNIKGQIQEMQEGTNQLKNKVLTGEQNLVKLIKKEMSGINQSGKNIQSNLGKANEAIKKSTYFTKEDLMNRSKDIKELKAQYQNFMAKGRDLFRSLDHLEFDQAKKQFGEYMLRGETLTDNTINILRKMSPNLNMANMHTKQASKYVGAALKNAVKITTKTGPSGLLIGGTVFTTADHFINKKR